MQHMRFEDQNRIMFTKALIDNPTDAWEILYDTEDEETRKPVGIRHRRTKHEWALTDWDETAQAWAGIRQV